MIKAGGGGFMPGGPFPFFNFQQNAPPKPPIAAALLPLFKPRLNIEYASREDVRGKPRPYEGIFDGHTDYIAKFEEEDPPEPQKLMTKDEIHYLQWKEKIDAHKAENRDKFKNWNPNEDPEVQGDPYKTLFVGRLSHETTDKTLKKEFERYGPIKRIRIVRDPKTGKSRGYAFVEYEKKEDFKIAYKQGDGRRVDGRKVMVDFERGRTIKDWKPRKFGGGRGDTRKTVPNFMPDYVLSNTARNGRSKSRSRSRSQEKAAKHSDRDGEREEKKKDRNRDRERDRDHRDGPRRENGEGQNEELEKEEQEVPRPDKDRKKDKKKKDKEKKDKDLEEGEERKKKKDKDKKKKKSRSKSRDKKKKKKSEKRKDSESGEEEP